MRRNSRCKRCSLHETAEYVCLMGRGNKEADLMLVGEAPGHREEDIGKPFQGRAGKLLDEILEELGIDREDIFITNVVKCRPPKNRTPFPSETEACKIYLKREFEEVRPSIIVSMGKAATEVLLDRKVSITKARGRCVEAGAYGIVPTVHPAYVLRNPSWRRALKRDLRAAWNMANSLS